MVEEPLDFDALEVPSLDDDDEQRPHDRAVRCPDCGKKLVEQSNGWWGCEACQCYYPLAYLRKKGRCR